MDLKLELSGPSGSTFTVGGFDNPGHPWSFRRNESVDDGTYATTAAWIFNSGSGETTTCNGTWSAKFTNDRLDSAPVNWSNVSIRLYRFIGCAYEDALLLTGQTVTDSQLFQACNSITAGPAFVVASGGDVTFRAGSQVVLEPGFSVALGGAFSARIDSILSP